MKFLRTIYNLGLLNEQDGPPPPPGGEAEPSEPAEAPSEADMETETVGTLSPESEVLFVRLLKKAVVMNIEPEDIRAIEELNDINENNAREALESIIRLMKKYSTEIDINT